MAGLVPRNTAHLGGWAPQTCPQVGDCCSTDNLARCMACKSRVCLLLLCRKAARGHWPIARAVGLRFSMPMPMPRPPARPRPVGLLNTLEHTSSKPKSSAPHPENRDATFISVTNHGRR